ncbi:hypothetical protein CDAR_569731 [Caerostris darwini]|uniref:Uncharacterized protein n=1 Tax=Caerostris darwini TaxID=1538125 RepID=A0AAV4S1U6_9ARAC|nr:hypothetical protein CDAR_569731 [Caerostris darwini]
MGLTNGRHDCSHKVESTRIVPAGSLVDDAGRRRVPILPEQHLHVRRVHRPVVLLQEAPVDLPVSLAVLRLVLVLEPLEEPGARRHVHEHHHPQQQEPGVVFVQVQNTTATLTPGHRARSCRHTRPLAIGTRVLSHFLFVLPLALHFCTLGGIPEVTNAKEVLE